MKVSVVIPAFDEANRILPTLRRIEGYMKETFGEHEIIVVDDGSKDRTVELIQEEGIPSVRILRNEKNLGKGASVKKGVLQAKGEMILFSDSDLSTPIEEIDAFVKAIETGADIAIASRNAKGANKEVKQPVYRQSMGKLFPLFVRLLGLGNFSDTQCGFKMFKKEAAQRLFSYQRMKGFIFDVEVLFLAKKSGYEMKELPVTWLDKEESKVIPFRDGPKMLAGLLAIWWNALRGAYRPLWK